MKRYIFLIVLFVAVPLAAYQAGPAGRANFGSNASQQPAQNGYRTFTNYNNRNWNQGVQTKPVQTNVAGTSATEFEAVEKKQPVGKQTVAAPKSTGKPVATPPTTATPAAQQPAAATGMPANADPTAMLQQAQAMMQNMPNIQNMMGTPAPGQPAATGQANAVPTMPAGMPDLSALMGGAMPTTPAPTSTPVKK